MNEAPGNRSNSEEIDLDDEEFDSFARTAAESLRSVAPDHGADAAIRAGNRQRTKRLALELSVVLALVVIGAVVFSRSRPDNHDVDTPPQPTESTLSPTTTTIESAADIRQWFVNYTGNPSGPATGAPVKFGVVTTTFPSHYQLDSAVKYLNAEAGGAGGRPIELDTCVESLSTCADRFAADPAVVAVLEDLWQAPTHGSQCHDGPVVAPDCAFSESITDALNGRKPLQTTYWDSGITDVGYYPTYYETLWAMAIESRALTKPGAQVLVVAASADGVDADSPVLTSGLEGREVVVVNYSQLENLADTIRGAGAANAAAVVLAAPPLERPMPGDVKVGQLCNDFARALDELGMHAAVIVDGCVPHEGWYKLNVGFNETSPGPQSGASQIVTAMPHLGDITLEGPASQDVREAGALLGVIRMINQLGGPSKATPAALDQAMHAFTGPLPLAAGPLDCSSTGKLAERRRPGSCVRFVDVHQFVDGSWVDRPPVDLAS